MGPGIEKRAKYWFLRAICFFVLPSAVGLSPRNLPWHLLPLSCRRWAVVKGLAVAPATEPATVLTAALPWYLAPELPTLTAANGRRAPVLPATVLTAALPAAVASTAVLTAATLWHQPPSIPPWGLLLHQVVNVLDVVVLLKFVEEFLYLGFGLWVKDFEVCGRNAGELTGDDFQALLL